MVPVAAVEIVKAMDCIPGSPTRSKWDSPLTLVPEASTCCTPPISVNATDCRSKRHEMFALRYDNDSQKRRISVKEEKDRLIVY